MFDIKIKSNYRGQSSKKDELGIGVLNHPAAKAAASKVCGFFTSCPSMAARWEGRKARRFLLRRVPGTPILSSCLPDWRRGGSYPTAPMESIMTNQSNQQTCAQTEASSVAVCLALFKILSIIDLGLEPNEEDIASAKSLALNFLARC